jgi:RHS repeat-associated protein
MLQLDANGARVRHSVFTPFGELYAQVGVDANRKRWAGHQRHDDTGLYYMQARWMDPGAGTFLSVDPVVADAFDPQSVNAYAYARNNPVSNIDPTGSIQEYVIYAKCPCGPASAPPPTPSVSGYGMAGAGSAGLDGAFTGLGAGIFGPYEDGAGHPPGPQVPTPDLGSFPEADSKSAAVQVLATGFRSGQPIGIVFGALGALTIYVTWNIAVSGVWQQNGEGVSDEDGTWHVDPDTGEVRRGDPNEGRKAETLDRGSLSQQVPRGPRDQMPMGEEPPPENFRQKVMRAIRDIIELWDSW